MRSNVPTTEAVNACSVAREWAGQRGHCCVPRAPGLATSSPERQREKSSQPQLPLVRTSSAGRRLGGLGRNRPRVPPDAGSLAPRRKGPLRGSRRGVRGPGRNVVDCLNTGYKMWDEKKMLVTYGHDGPWEQDDPADENRFTMEAWGAQMELRAIQRRNRDATMKIRAASRPKGKPSYGFQYVRTARGGQGALAPDVGPTSFVLVTCTLVGAHDQAKAAPTSGEPPGERPSSRRRWRPEENKPRRDRGLGRSPQQSLGRGRTTPPGGAGGRGGVGDPLVRRSPVR